MTNALIDARTRFDAAHPEVRVALGSRDWGVIDTGGAGPALLMLPGTLGRADVFWQQIEALAGRARVLAVSYPGSGGIAEWAEDLAALCKARGIARATVLGSSLGGYVAQYFAGVHPDLAEGLIAANTLHTVQGIADRPPYSADLDNAPFAAIRDGFAQNLTAWKASAPELSDLIGLLLGEVSGRIPEDELRARLNALKTGPELPPVALPSGRIATVESADDPLIPPPMREAVRARLSPAAAYRFESGGHYPYILRAPLYTALIEEMLGLTPVSADWGAGALRIR